jgi:hypothetical protein
VKHNSKSQSSVGKSETSSHEDDVGLFDFFDDEEASAFETEIAGLDRSELIKLILRDREHIAWLWSTLLKKNEERSRRKRKELETKKANYGSAKIFGVEDFSALVLQAIQAASDPGIKCVRTKLIELRLKNPSNKLSEADLVRYVTRELTSEKLRTIRKRLKSVPF